MAKLSKKEERISQQGHPDIKLDSSVESKYAEPWITEYIIEKRNQKLPWETIAEGLRVRGLPNITAGQCSSLHKRALARTVTTSTDAKEDFIEFTQDLKNIYGDAIKLMGDYVKSLRYINEEIGKSKVVDDEGKIDILKTQMAIAKQIPLATGLMREVREYVKNQMSLYDIIQETKEDDVVWSETQMITYVQQLVPTIIKERMKEIKKKEGEGISLARVENLLLEGFN